MAVVLATPVLDARLNWVGLRLAGELPLPAVAQLIAKVEAASPFPYQKIFLPFDPSWSDAPSFPLPAGQTVLMLPAPPESDAPLANSCRALRGKGVHVAAPGSPDAALRGVADVFVLPAAEARQTLSEKALRQVLESESKLFADGVDSTDLFDWCAATGFPFIALNTMGYVPTPKGQAQSPSRMMLLKLLNLVTQDAETGQLEDVFKQEPKLAFDLLRLVNSASMGLRNKIANFRQAITILGRRQLQRWLQLLLFAHQKEGAHGPSILMQQAATRGRLMELLSKETSPGASVDDQEQAFMVGLFSMLDVLMGSPLAELLKSLRLADAVEQALLHRNGDLGLMVGLVEQAEAQDVDGVARSLERMGISGEAFIDAQLAALGWVYRLGISE